MNTTYYEILLREAKDYINSLETAREKLYRAVSRIAAWLLGINVFLVYRIWDAVNPKCASLSVFLSCMALTVPCLVYLYRLFFAVSSRKVNGTEPKPFFYLEGKEIDHVYIEYINNYQYRIDLLQKAHETLINNYKRLIMWFLLFVLAFVLTTVFIGI